MAEAVNSGLGTWTGYLGGTSGKEPACQCRRRNNCRFDPWVWKIHWRREWQPTPVFLPGGSHGQRSRVGSSKSWTWLSDLASTQVPRQAPSKIAHLNNFIIYRDKYGPRGQCFLLRGTVCSWRQLEGHGWSSLEGRVCLSQYVAPLGQAEGIRAPFAPQSPSVQC